MSESDSDDFFYNQNVSDEYDETMRREDDLIDTSTFKSKTFTIKKRILRSAECYSEEEKKDSKKLKSISEGSIHLDSDSSELEEPIILNSDSSEDGESVIAVDSMVLRSVEEKNAEDEEDQTLDFLSELVGKAEVFLKEHSPDNSPRRIYNINFISQIDGSRDRKVNVKVTGRKTFETILPIVMDTFVKTYRIKKSLQNFYIPADLTMFRNGVEVLPFSNCDSMRIPALKDLEQIQVEIIIVHKSMCNHYKEEYKKNRTSRLKSLEVGRPDFDEEVLQVLSPTSRFDDFEKELEDAPKLAGSDADLVFDQNEKSRKCIKIMLVDKNNSRVPISVTPDTVFTAVIEKYREIKSIPYSFQIKLFFDHSQINPLSTVSDEDVEEGDMIEVDFHSF